MKRKSKALKAAKTKYKNTTITVERTYNNLVLDVLDNGRISKIVHTLGNSTISEEFKTKPVEKALKTNGFQGYWNSIVNRKKNIDIIRKSYSPSAYAVRKLGSVNYNNMKSWFETHIITKHK